MNVAIEDRILYERLQRVLEEGWHDIPEVGGYGGSGAPGKLLEELLGVKGGNNDLPDTGRWELKYHGSKSPITLFHKDAQPSGHIEKLLEHYGWADKHNKISFRHTIWGRSNRGFSLEKMNDSIYLRNPNDPIPDLPFWSCHILTNAFIQKLRRLIVVKGERKGNQVRYLSAELFREPKADEFIAAICDGRIAIDFDARTKSKNPNVDGWKARNHGTKFRIKIKNLSDMYIYTEAFTSPENGA